MNLITVTAVSALLYASVYSRPLVTERADIWKTSTCARGISATTYKLSEEGSLQFSTSEKVKICISKCTTNHLLVSFSPEANECRCWKPLEAQEDQKSEDVFEAHKLYDLRGCSTAEHKSSVTFRRELASSDQDDDGSDQDDDSDSGKWNDDDSGDKSDNDDDNDDDSNEAPDSDNDDDSQEWYDNDDDSDDDNDSDNSEDDDSDHSKK
uniref:Uncharacterized protein n=1 Tax=Tetraselmis sp. GSL018 TaxID=582737 RepID=A0A061QT25_9CHLO|mmetsp:Transcript_17854/g.42855  ORF Transcript_17854/g.42855 Transcript_17854/m.42855 type:complete len:209 (+) Transcript_17854:147-773(+)|eukprot:CAMPEP_0177610280 /NCGR_PEP_ID=MMETSP0419_2-20121207/19672_1 /TAXON_ID=582737 /ORGANISM="Tetraselmis sp., Strain GSL018" /LENGTH=208 /DNA_ID=CAMNT_0019105529 /DNA_START=40 /DNA_END=666 /DNA_ORIENTATION=+